MVPWFSWFQEFVPGYLEMVPGYLEMVPGYLEKVPSYLGVVPGYLGVVAAALHVTGSHMLRAAREKAAMLCVMQLCIPCMPSLICKIHSSTLYVA